MKRLLQLAFTLVWASCAFAASRSSDFELITRNRAAVEVQESAKQEWANNFFAAPEFFVFKDKEELTRYLASSSLSKAASQRILEKFRNWEQLSLREDIQVASTNNLDAGAGGFFLTQDLIDDLPKQFLMDLYYDQQLRKNEKDWFQLNKSYGELLKELRAANVSDEVINRILKFTFEKAPGKIALFPHGAIWHDLPSAMRERIIDSVSQKLSEGARVRAVNVNLRITAKTRLSNIAREYALGRDPAVLERWLERVLRARAQELKATGYIDIPLENILPKAVRSEINSYADCNGPNCYNAGIRFDDQSHAQPEFTSASKLNSELHSDKYHMLADETLKPGDRILYRDGTNGTYKHISTYVGTDSAGEAIVYTKNGMYQGNPRIFQRMSDNERFYFPDKPFKREVYRPAASSNLTTDLPPSQNFINACKPLIRAIFGQRVAR